MTRPAKPGRVLRPTKTEPLEPKFGYTLEDVGTIAAVREAEVKKLKKFVELLNGNIEILDTWEVANYF